MWGANGDSILDHPAITDRLRIPIAAGGRSLNLANAAAIAIYEGWRQLEFAEPQVRDDVDR